MAGPGGRQEAQRARGWRDSPSSGTQTRCSPFCPCAASGWLHRQRVCGCVGWGWGAGWGWGVRVGGQAPAAGELVTNPAEADQHQQQRPGRRLWQPGTESLGGLPVQRVPSLPPAPRWLRPLAAGAPSPPAAPHSASLSPTPSHPASAPHTACRQESQQAAQLGPRVPGLEANPTSGCTSHRKQRSGRHD